MTKHLDQLLITEIAAPSTPAAGVLAVYAGTDHKIHTLDSTAVNTALGAAAGSVTRTLQLPITAAIFPDGSATNLSAGTQRQKSSATAPAPYYQQLTFDPAALWWADWGVFMPTEYVSGPIMQVVYKMTSAVTGNVIWNASVAAFTPGTDTTDMDAKAFATVNTLTVAVPATTAGRLATAAITLTNADSVAAGDFVVFRLGRDGANASDTAAGNAEVVAVAINYTGS